MADNGFKIGPTPRNAIAGLLADALKSAHNYTQQPHNRNTAGGKVGLLAAALGEMVGLGDIAATADRMSYGLPLTEGTGMARQMLPETRNAILALAPQAAVNPAGALRTVAGLSGAVDTGMGRAIFMGAGSKTWDKAAAAKAEQMLARGADPRAVWQETGTFRSPDGMLRQEIDDSAALVNPSFVNGKHQENDIMQGMPGFNFGPATEMLRHPALKDAYGAGLVPNTFVGNKNTLLGDGVQGAYDEVAGSITLNAPAKAPDARSTMLHELQHAIQQREGFARGGSPEWAAQEQGRLRARINFLNQELSSAAKGMDLYPKGSPQYAELKRTYDAAMEEKLRMSPSLVQGGAFDSYRALAGEAEARAVQARMNMNPQQRRAAFPLDSYDVPLDQLIVRR